MAMLPLYNKIVPIICNTTLLNNRNIHRFSRCYLVSGGCDGKKDGGGQNAWINICSASSCSGKKGGSATCGSSQSSGCSSCGSNKSGSAMCSSCKSSGGSSCGGKKDGGCDKCGEKKSSWCSTDDSKSAKGKSGSSTCCANSGQRSSRDAKRSACASCGGQSSGGGKKGSSLCSGKIKKSSQPSMYDQRKYGHKLSGDGNVPSFGKVEGVPNGVFRCTHGEYLGLGAGKQCYYKNPEFFSYHHMSFFDIHVHLSKCRLQPPNSGRKPKII